MKKAKRNSVSSVILCIFEVLVGILLLIDPVGFTSGIIIAGGIVLMLSGLMNVIKYFGAEAQEAAAKQFLTKGLASILFGVFCAFNHNWFIATFPVLTILYGIIVLVTGLSKVQLTFDMLRVKNKKWFLAIISAVISIVCGIVILDNPFTSTAVLWIFTGITLIVEALVDVITAIFGGRGKKDEAEAEVEADFEVKE